MGSTDTLRKLKKCRMRLQRITDGKIINGRVVDVSMAEISAAVSASGVLEIGDLLSLEIHGPMLKVMTKARVCLVAPDGVRMAIQGELRHLPSTESARIEVQNVTSAVEWKAFKYVAQVLDVSREGLAIKIMESIPPGSTIRVDVNTPLGRQQLKGVVRYCREMNDGLGHCRVGLQLYHESRIAIAKWFAFFEHAQEAC